MCLLQLASELKELQTRKKLLTSNTQQLTAQDRKRMTEELESCKREWCKRRRMALDNLKAILENWPKDKKSLYEDIGVETDEDVGVSLNSL